MKDKIDFRLEKKNKQLVEMAAHLKDMTTSGYMNYLVETSIERIIEDISAGFTSEELLSHILDDTERNELSAIVKRTIALNFAERNFENEDLYFKIYSDYKRVFMNYIKNKES
jgi:uncharacterized protein (DUF1778 family)